jgi:tetratricopeptide (TPR) repeat protein
MSNSNFSEDKAQVYALIFSIMVVVGYVLPWKSGSSYYSGITAIINWFQWLVELIKRGRSDDNILMFISFLFSATILINILFCHINNIFKLLKNAPRRNRVNSVAVPFVICILLLIIRVAAKYEPGIIGYTIVLLADGSYNAIGIIFVYFGIFFGFISTLASKDTFYIIHSDFLLKAGTPIKTEITNDTKAVVSLPQKSDYQPPFTQMDNSINKNDINILTEKIDSAFMMMQKIFVQNENINRKLDLLLKRKNEPSPEILSNNNAVSIDINELIQKANELYKSNNFSAALEYFNNAIAQKKNDFELFSKRANTLFMLKDYDGAIRDYDKSLTIKPDSGIIYYYRGYARLMKKDVIQAKPDLEKALSMGIKQAGELLDRYCR